MRVRRTWGWCLEIVGRFWGTTCVSCVCVKCKSSLLGAKSGNTTEVEVMEEKKNNVGMCLLEGFEIRVVTVWNRVKIKLKWLGVKLRHSFKQPHDEPRCADDEKGHGPEILDVEVVGDCKKNVEVISWDFWTVWWENRRSFVVWNEVNMKWKSPLIDQVLKIVMLYFGFSLNILS